MKGVKRAERNGVAKEPCSMIHIDFQRFFHAFDSKKQALINATTAETFTLSIRCNFIYFKPREKKYSIRNFCSNGQ